MQRVKCNKCGYVGDKSEFSTGKDFVQQEFISSCANPDCDNKQNPGDASMRMFSSDKQRPFVYIPSEELDDPRSETIRRSNQAS